MRVRLEGWVEARRWKEKKGAPGMELTAWEGGGMAGVWVNDWGKFEPERAW